MPTLAVIIARRGSKGLHNKAMQPLLGKPVIAWTIEHALGCKRVDQVVLSSDCGPGGAPVGAVLSHQEFLEGKYNDVVRKTFGEQILQEMIETAAAARTA